MILYLPHIGNIVYNSEICLHNTKSCLLSSLKLILKDILIIGWLTNYEGLIITSS